MCIEYHGMEGMATIGLSFNLQGEVCGCVTKVRYVSTMASVTCLLRHRVEVRGRSNELHLLLLLKQRCFLCTCNLFEYLKKKSQVKERSQISTCSREAAAGVTMSG